MTPDLFAHIKDTVAKLKAGGSVEFELNLACWLGDRARLLVAEVDRLRAANAALAGALAPFAAYGDEQLAELPDDTRVTPMWVVCRANDRVATLGDCRRAADALAKYGDPT